MAKPSDLLQGTLEMLILKAISLEPVHGYGILLRIEQLSKERLQVQQGSLYPALYRLERKGWISAEWGESDNKRRAKYYRLTAEGRASLHAETENWNRMRAGINGVLNALTAESSS
jgi:PadR family transcriptional regulator PadR